MITIGAESGELGNNEMQWLVKFKIISAVL